MSGPDVLGWGPDEPTGPPRPRRPGWPERVRQASSAVRRRRWTGLAGTVLLGAAAAVLAVRAGADPEAPPPPQPTRTFALGPPIQLVSEVAFGPDRAYALVAGCVGPEETRQCRYRLMQRGLGRADWTVTAVQSGPVAGAAGSARLFVDGDRLTVVDQPTVGNVLTSPDRGRTMTVQGLSSAPPVPAVLKDDIVDLGLCDACINQLTVLEPRTGRLRPLAVQPPLGPAITVRLFAESAGALWTVGDDGPRLVSSVSVDGGRSWRTLPIGGGPGTAETAVLAPDGRRGAWLLVSRDADVHTPNEFSELWRVGDPTRPGAAWKLVTPAQRPKSVNGLLVSGGTALIRDENGQLQRLGPGGVLRALPPFQLDGAPLGPDTMVAGPGRLLLGIVNRPESTEPPRVALSRDGGESWQVEQLPP